jgi:hypothetical protein
MMKHMRIPHQYDLFGRLPETTGVQALPLAKQTEATLLLGKLLLEIVQAETAEEEKGGGDEQDHR